MAVLALRWLFGRLGRDIRFGREVDEVLGSVRSILIFGYMGVGDAIMFEPALSGILRRFKVAEVDLVMGSVALTREVFERIAASSNRQFRNVYQLDFKASARATRELNERLSLEGYDLCICPYTTPLPYFLKSISSCRLRAGQKIRAAKWYRPRANFLLNLYTWLEQSVNQREPERYMQFAHALGVPQISTTPSPIMRNGREAKVEVPPSIAVQLGVSAAMSWKQWPLDRFIEVLQLLDAEGYSFKLFGTLSETVEIQQIAASVRRAEHYIDSSLDVVTNELLKCSLFIGNDSGIGHLAVALGVPSVRVFGPSDRYGCEPYDPIHRIVYHELTCSPCWNLGMIRSDYNFQTCGHRNCLNHIGVDEVVATIRDLLPTL